jgi:Histidine kinase-, DNA gyrase B-, and HSP90-like ATPase
MTTIRTTRLSIREQGELLNQIAGTYKDFYRAAMEYIDNAVDAASILGRSGESFAPLLKIHVNSAAKTVTFTDNCGGMAPEELCDLLSEVGRSKKKVVPWANGQFGFGVHAFRAFARQAVFISRKEGSPEAKIKIDRNLDENAEVPCEATDGRQLDKPGTRVIISRFDPQVFKKSIFVKALVSEIEHHFDDVLRAELIRIVVNEDGSKPYECKCLNFSDLPGVSLKRKISVDSGGIRNKLVVDLKLLDRLQDNRFAVLTNKQRRVQNICDLKSYKNFVRNNGESSYVWSNPFVTGFVEINDLCSPNLTRDDLRDSPARDVLYDHLLEIQKELQRMVDETMDKKTQESFKKLGSVMSDCLSRILRNFRLKFEQLAPTGKPGQFEKKILEGFGDVPFGGNEPGGGGPGANQIGRFGGCSNDEGKSGIGDQEYGGGDAIKDKTSGAGASEERLVISPGPRIEFQNHAGEDRIIDLGNSLIINAKHPDFILRNASKSGKIKLDARLLNYVSLVIAPPCVHRLFERRGKVPSTLEAGTNIVDLSMRLEQELIATVIGQEIEGNV